MVSGNYQSKGKFLNVSRFWRSYEATSGICCLWGIIKLIHDNEVLKNEFQHWSLPPLLCSGSNTWLVDRGTSALLLMIGIPLGLCVLVGWGSFLLSRAVLFPFLLHPPLSVSPPTPSQSLWSGSGLVKSCSAHQKCHGRGMQASRGRWGYGREKRITTPLLPTVEGVCERRCQRNACSRKWITPFLQNLLWLPIASEIRLKLPSTTPLELREASAHLSMLPLINSCTEPSYSLTFVTVHTMSSARNSLPSLWATFHPLIVFFPLYLCHRQNYLPPQDGIVGRRYYCCYFNPYCPLK